ncbi:MAG: tetratricopeptide repeat protein [Candidatus Omnitrophica bacterium]|nr:tetratricopeptide repeat protein [Candidatus Omnitrophota bacterium]
MQVRKSILIFFIIAVNLAVYFNTLFAHFVWDDNILIVLNPYMQSFQHLPKFFTQDIWKVGIQTLTSGYYRPLQAASFILDYTLWQNNAFGYHLTNLIFQTLASILIFIFTGMLTKEKLIPFFAALIFSVHPVHTESVSFISGRVDLLTLTFILLSLILFLSYARGKKFIYYLLSLACFFISLLIKEMAVILPLLVIFLDYLFISQRKLKELIKNFPKFYLGFFIVLGLYLILRFYFIGWDFLLENKRYVSNFIGGTHPYWRVFTVIKIIVFYIRLLFFPYGLKADYFFPAANSLFEPAVLLGIIVLSFLVFIAFKNIRKNPLITFSIFWFFITVLPVSNIIPQGNVFAERYMYIPSVGFSMAIGICFFGLSKARIDTHYLNWQKSVYLVFLLLVIALGRVTFERNKVWQNEFTLWYETAKASPESPRAHLNLASAYYAINFLDNAKKEIKAALEIYPVYYEAIEMLGHIYLKENRLNDAIKMFKAAIRIYPDRATAYNGLGVAYARNNQYKEAIQVTLIALKNNPYFDEARHNLDAYYEKSGHKAK